MINHTGALRKLASGLAGLPSRGISAIIIAGGGHFADMVRELYNRGEADEKTAHLMALSAMDINGYLLAGTHENLEETSRLENAFNMNRGKTSVPVLTGIRNHIINSSLPQSWEATSDSIAFYLASLAEAECCVLVKDVDGLMSKEGMLMEKAGRKYFRQNPETGCLDRYLPRILEKHNIPLLLVNGFYPERISAAIQNKPFKGTRISW